MTTQTQALEGLQMSADEMRMLGIAPEEEVKDTKSEEADNGVQDEEKEEVAEGEEAAEEKEETEGEEVKQEMKPIKKSDKKEKEGYTDPDEEVEEKTVVTYDPEVLKKTVAVIDKHITSIENEAGWLKQQYEATNDQKYADRYNEKVKEYNELLKERKETGEEVARVEVKETVKTQLNEYVNEMTEDDRKAIMPYILKAMKSTPYTNDGFVLAERIYSKALRLQDIAAKNIKASEGKKIENDAVEKAKTNMKKVAVAGQGTNGTDVVNWADVSKRAAKGDKNALRQIMHHDDPFLKKMQGR